MSKPATTPFTDDAYGRLEPVAAKDEALAWPLLQFLLANGAMFAQVERLVRARDGAEAWSQALDVDRTPAEFVQWLGQMVGVRVTPNLAEAAQRQQVHDLNSLKRATPDSLRKAVAATLTGAKFVKIEERKGANVAIPLPWDNVVTTWDATGGTWDAAPGSSTQVYSITVTVKATECPDAATTQAAGEAAKLSGLLLTLVIDGEYAWDQETGTWDGAGTTTWDQAATVPI